MTLVEFFSNEQIDNIVSSLAVKPNKIIFVGYREVMTSDILESTEKYFDKKNINIQTEFVYVEKYSLKNIIDKLTYILKNNSDCIFDFTGGDGLILAGMGYLMAQYDICAVKVDVFKNLLYTDLKGDKEPEKINIENSVCENIILHGGSIGKTKQNTLSYFLSDEYKSDVFRLWSICSKDNSLWNSTVSIFKNLQVNRFPQEMKNFIFAELEKEGFIKVTKEDNEVVYFNYKNEITEICLNDPGIILELYTYWVLKDCGLFSDVDVGVNIDWDGIIHNLRNKSMDTSNEIDVVAMKGILPFYISCKNGKVTKDTLYELETVSKRFGGKYAKKILVAPILNKKNISNEYILNRAKDMDIKVITDVSEISEKEYTKKFI